MTSVESIALFSCLIFVIWLVLITWVIDHRLRLTLWQVYKAREDAEKIQNQIERTLEIIQGRLKKMESRLGLNDDYDFD